MLEVGASSIVINNDIGTQVQGASVAQVAEYIRDDLEANLLFVRSNDAAVLLISCDVAALETHYMDQYRQAIAQRTQLDIKDVLITCTHTHAGPCVLETSYFKKADQAYLERLGGWLTDAAAQAVASARLAQLRMAKGELALGFNRRTCWANGEHNMGRKGNGHAFTGTEGPTDATHIAMIAQDESGQPIVVFHSNSAHPTMFYGANYYSAEYPGEARAIIRNALGELPVLYINGPFGDISPVDVLAGTRLSGEQHVKMMGSRVAGKTLDLLASAPLQESIQVGHRSEILQIPIRLPTDEEVAKGRALLARVDAGEEIAAWETMWAHGRVRAHDQLADSEHENIPVHVVRIGDLALATHPVELYCQFGIDLRRRSPAPMTSIADLTNGFSGYCPTYGGYLGGGYSGATLWWTRLAPEAGYRIVDEAARMLYELWSTD